MRRSSPRGWPLESSPRVVRLAGSGNTAHSPVSSSNRYSRRWFETFLGRIDASLVEREIAFLMRQLTPGSRVLDLCCGPGRHSGPLVEAGYRIVGLDRDAAALRDAMARAPHAVFVRGDMFSIPCPDASFDAVICMWQSFGHFDSAGNTAVLAEMARVLRPNGTLVLDVYHRGFHEARLGERVLERDGARVHERRTMSAGRLHVSLRYERDGSGDEFEWQLYTPAELAALGEQVGLEVRLICSGFDEQSAASEEYSLMQVVLEGIGDRG
jgi:SAM-dependent methyltransferase